MTTKTNTQIIGEMSLKQWTPVSIDGTAYFSVQQVVEALQAKDQHSKDTCEKMVRDIREAFEEQGEDIEVLDTIAKSYGVEIGQK